MKFQGIFFMIITLNQILARSILPENHETDMNTFLYEYGLIKPFNTNTMEIAECIEHLTEGMIDTKLLRKIMTDGSHETCFQFTDKKQSRIILCPSGNNICNNFQIIDEKFRCGDFYLNSSPDAFILNYNDKLTATVDRKGKFEMNVKKEFVDDFKGQCNKSPTINNKCPNTTSSYASDIVALCDFINYNITEICMEKEKLFNFCLEYSSHIHSMEDDMELIRCKVLEKISLQCAAKVPSLPNILKRVYNCDFKIQVVDENTAKRTESTQVINENEKIILNETTNTPVIIIVIIVSFFGIIAVCIIGCKKVIQRLPM